jgi:hypothetical protein
MVMTTRPRPPGRSHLRHQSDPGDGWFFSHAENIHSAHGKERKTPAQATNLTDHAWTVEELLTNDY